MYRRLARTAAALLVVLCADRVHAQSAGAPADAAGEAWGLGAPWSGQGELDRAGLSPFRAQGSHSPAGLRFETPHALRPLQRSASSGWAWGGELELALRSADADERSVAFRRYRDPAGGLRLDRLGFEAGNARGHWLEALVLAPGRADGSAGIGFGRRNDWRIELGLFESPHRDSSTARSIWQGAGTGTLTLLPAPGVAAGGASVNNAVNADALRRLLARTPEQAIGIVRRSGGARFELRLAEGWTLQSSYLLEHRSGTRPFGGNQGNGELIEPVDQRTHELRTALQFADERTQFNLGLRASVFRNAIDALSWENPFSHPVGVLRILGGRASLAPDNEAYHLRADLARALPGAWRGRLTALVDLGFLRQNDRLLPPTATRGIGAPFGTGFDGNYDRWNTVAALPRERAEAAIDTRLVDLGLSLSPAERLTLRASLRHHETRNHTDYTAFNPIAARYGYIIQDTNPSTVYGGSNNVHIRSIPFAGTQDTLRVAAETRLGRRSSLSAEFERDEIRREHRERDRTGEDRLRLAFTDRGFDLVNLRLSWEEASRRGSEYQSNPYRDFYTEALPDYTDTRANLLARLHGLEELRKFDLADRRQRIVKLRIGVLPRPDLDLGLALQSRTNDYPAEFGRTGTQAQQTASLEMGFVPAATTSLNAHLSWQRGWQQQAGVASLGDAFSAGCLSLPPSCSNRFAAPRSIYPAELAWTASQRERTLSVGVGARHDFGGPSLEAQLTRVRSRSPLGYTYASADALQSPSLAAQAGDGFADAGWSLGTVDLGLRWPLSPAVALRLTLRHEEARVSDWHTSGLDAGTVVGTRYYLDAGPGGYRVTVFGVAAVLRY